MIQLLQCKPTECTHFMFSYNHNEVCAFCWFTLCQVVTLRVKDS